MAYVDTLIWAKGQLVALRNELFGIEADIIRYHNALPSAIAAPVTSALQTEAWGWKQSLDSTESALFFWIGNIQEEIDGLTS